MSQIETSEIILSTSDWYSVLVKDQNKFKILESSLFSFRRSLKISADLWTICMCVRLESQIDWNTSWESIHSIRNSVVKVLEPEYRVLLLIRAVRSLMP